MATPHQRRKPNDGVSYLEICLAILILAICLVSAAKLLPALLASQRALETKYQLSLIAQEKLDTATTELDGNFVERDESADCAPEGHPDWRYHLVVIIPAAGGGRYATVRSETWADANGNSSLDPDEPQVRYDTITANCDWSP